MPYEAYQDETVVIMSYSDCSTKCSHCYILYKGNYPGDELFDVVTMLKQSEYNLFY